MFQAIISGKGIYEFVEEAKFMKQLIIIIGPNGVGKSTVAKK